MKMMMTNELPAEIMENGIHYTLVGDYYFPTCMLADRSPNGKWASLYERYLQEKHPHEYTRVDASPANSAHTGMPTCHWATCPPAYK